MVECPTSAPTSQGSDETSWKVPPERGTLGFSRRFFRFFGDKSLKALACTTLYVTAGRQAGRQASIGCASDC